MEINFSLIQKYNPWWENVLAIEQDEKIMEFKNQLFKYLPDFIQQKFAPGVYTVLGPRQVGKSTSLKLLIQKLLLEKKVKPENIFFFQGDILENFKDLLDILETYLQAMAPKNEFYIFLDEVSFIKEWPRAIKHLIDRGDFKKAIIVLSGSLSLQIKGGAEFMPGRRGKSERKDFVQLPLDFAAYLRLRKIIWAKIDFASLLQDPAVVIKSMSLHKLYSQKSKIQRFLADYLLSGGFLLVINEALQNKKISDSTYSIYWDWLKGDLLKMERRENVFLEIMQEAIKHLGSTFSYNNIAQNISAKSHLTVIDYLDLAEKIFLLNIYPNFNLNKKLPNLRKQKKLHFLDPFLFHLLNGRLLGSTQFFTTAKQALSQKTPQLIESLVSNYLKNKFPQSGFWRNHLEVDFVGIMDNAIYGFEIKIQEKIKSGDIQKLRELKQFKQIVMVSKNEFKLIDDILIIPYWLLLLME